MQSVLDSHRRLVIHCGAHPQCPAICQQAQAQPALAQKYQTQSLAAMLYLPLAICAVHALCLTGFEQMCMQLLQSSKDALQQGSCHAIQ